MTSRTEKRTIRAVIMDFDGLILDTEGPAFQSYQEIFEEYGGTLPLSAWAAWVGGSPHMFDPIGYLESQLGREVDREGIRLRQRQREDELIKAQVVHPTRGWILGSFPWVDQWPWLDWQVDAVPEHRGHGLEEPLLLGVVRRLAERLAPLHDSHPDRMAQGTTPLGNAPDLRPQVSLVGRGAVSYAQLTHSTWL